MSKLIKIAVVVSCVWAMSGFVGCGKESASTSPADNTTSVSQGDSAKDVAINKVKGAGFDKVTFVSEKRDGDKSLVVVNATVDGQTEETKVYCVKVNGAWTVEKMD